VFDKFFRQRMPREEVETHKQRAADLALAKAALYGQVDIVRALLDSGADINARTIISDWTPLMAAASEGKTAVVQILLDRGADINARSPSGNTALMVAARNGQVATLQILLERGADVNERTPDGVSTLSAAAAFGQLHSVRLLLNQGAKDDGGALQAAIQFGNAEIIKLLKEI
jgi:ankyrin repeat protein